jgi:hypothetical protein
MNGTKRSCPSLTGKPPKAVELTIESGIVMAPLGTQKQKCMVAAGPARERFVGGPLLK